jgi:hypothetical protein
VSVCLSVFLSLSLSLSEQHAPAQAQWSEHARRALSTRYSLYLLYWYKSTNTDAGTSARPRVRSASVGVLAGSVGVLYPLRMPSLTGGSMPSVGISCSSGGRASRLRARVAAAEAAASCASGRPPPAAGQQRSCCGCCVCRSPTC